MVKQAQIGFIGAGRVGTALGKYLSMHKLSISGYYSRRESSARESAEIVGTRYFLEVSDLIKESNLLFLTVSDHQIETVWNQIKTIVPQEMVICHCSGVYSSQIFSENVFAYSIHPLCAISQKEDSWQLLKKSVFTIEGHAKYFDEIVQTFQGFGNIVCTISAKDKFKYHCAAVMASNQIIALLSMAESLLVECGFEQEIAQKMIGVLAEGNLENIKKQGFVQALTGPVERNDVETVRHHLQAISKKQADVYRILSRQLVEIAQQKNPERDYENMKQVLAVEAGMQRKGRK